MRNVAISLAAIVILGVGSSAQAQTAPNPNTVQFNKPFAVQFEDPDLGLDGFNVYIDGAKVATVGASVLASGVGTIEYAAGVSKGTHTLYVEAFVSSCVIGTAVVSPCATASAVLTFDSVPGVKPTAPTNLKVIRR